MKRLFPRRLLYQFLLFILVVMALVLCIQVALLLHIRSQEIRTAQDYTDSLVSSVEHTISTNLQNVERAGYALSYNDDLKELYSQPIDHQTNITGVLDLVKLIYYDNQGQVLDVSIIGPGGSQRSLLMGISDQMHNALLDLYNFKDRKNTNRQFLFFKSGTDFRNDYYIYVAPLLGSFSLTSPEETKLATIVIVCDTAPLKRSVNVVDPGKALLYVTDAHHEVLWSNQPDFSTADYQTLLKGSEINSSQKIEGTNLTITGINVNRTSVAGQEILQFSFYGVLVLFVALLITFLFIRSKVLEPMMQLRNEIEHVGKQGLSQRVKIYDSDEMNYIAAWINAMLAQLENMTEQNLNTQQRLYETELLKNKAELYSLRNQINPHFLYNTLQCMRGIAVENEVPELADMSSALFNIFRYSIKGEECTTVEEELFIARQYLHIFELRYEGNFEYQIEAGDAVMDLSMIKMTLQPLLENSIQHGFSNHQGVMRVKIQVVLEGDSVMVCVDDNGEGIPLERLREINTLLNAKNGMVLDSSKDSSYGLENINHRLHLAYGQQYRLEIQNLPVGTRVKITFPAVEADQNCYIAQKTHPLT